MAYNETRIITPTYAVGTTIFTANDVVGNLIQINTGKNSGVIRRLNITDDDNEKAAMTLYLFSAAPTTFVDNDAFAPVVADLKLLIDTVSIASGDYTTVNGNAYAVKKDLNIDYSTLNGIVYGYLVCTATPTYTASADLHLRFTVWDDQST